MLVRWESSGRAKEQSISPAPPGIMHATTHATNPLAFEMKNPPCREGDDGKQGGNAGGDTVVMDIDHNKAGSREEMDGSEEDEGEYELSLGMVAMIKSRSGTSTAKAKWQLMSFGMAIFQVFCMFALALSAAYTTCTDPSDCRLGQVCYDLFGTRRATCEDCQYVVQRLSAGGSRVAGAYTGPLNTTQAYCAGVLEGEQAAYLGITHMGQGCLYVEKYYRKAGGLDRIVRIGAFVLLALVIAKERRRQCVSDYIRHDLYTLSYCLDVRRCEAIDKSGLFKALLWKVQGLILDKVLLMMLPAGMIVLLLRSGFSAAGVLLDGLSIGFLLELDTLAIAVLLDAKLTAGTKRHFTEILNSAKHRDGIDGKAFDVYCKRRPLVRGVASFILLIVLFELLRTYKNCQDASHLSIRNAQISVLLVPLLEELLAPLPSQTTNTSAVCTKEWAKAMLWHWCLIVVEILVGYWLFDMFWTFSDKFFYGLS